MTTSLDLLRHAALVAANLALLFFGAALVWGGAARRATYGTVTVTKR